MNPRTELTVAELHPQVDTPTPADVHVGAPGALAAANAGTTDRL
ncbi:hypothetical protein [Streptomyces sp. NPDC058240]